MGILVAKAYATTVAGNAADHTYVECGTGMRAWGCWGGKTGGAELQRAPGSTARANSIAEFNERAGITCYLINGVCHQAANRILLPALIIVDQARGYRISEALFGTYGRPGPFSCTAPFKHHVGTSGDLNDCIPTAGSSTAVPWSSSRLQQFEYLNRVLKLYAFQKKAFTRGYRRDRVEAFHDQLFRQMVSFYLGKLLVRGQMTALRRARINIERNRMMLEFALQKRQMTFAQFASAFDELTIVFQELMAKLMTHSQYETLFALNPNEKVVLRDNEIIEKLAMPKGMEPS